MHQAQDTFTAELGDGTPMVVVKGQYLPDGHELVKRDRDGAKVLFRPVDLGEDERPAKSEPKKADPPKAAPPVKPAAGKAAS